MNRYTMEFTLTSDKMPEKSGYYVCVALESKIVADMYYSKELEMFNVYEEYGKEKSETAIEVFAYAELPDWADFPEWKK